MKVLMFGWEFPPYKSGGLGTHCFGLTKALHNQGTKITFVMPRTSKDVHAHYVKLIGANNEFKIISINANLMPYINSGLLTKEDITSNKGIYGPGLFEEIRLYSERAKEIAKKEDFDVIHCHDWMTYQAGINAKKVSNKPLVITVHSTEFDRTGGNPNQYVYDIERMGMHLADRIIAVSGYTKSKIVEHYGISEEKVSVVYNAVAQDVQSFSITQNNPTVLYLGRITIQKGPEYLLYAAKKVLEHIPEARFIYAGDGDMLPWIIKEAARLGLSDKVLFTGFISGDAVHKLYQMADLYVMPSISEPFGITPLESLVNGTPTLISKQSGVSEVLNHCLKVDFWDINQMANKIIATLKYKELHNCLKNHGCTEVKGFNWANIATDTLNVYNMVV